MSFLVTVEGLDGMGKSTFVKALSESIPNSIASKEPGNVWWKPDMTKAIRQFVLQDKTLSPLMRELLFYVDAAIHKEFIDNQRGTVVVSDRGLWSHLAYLRGYLKTKQIDFEIYNICKMLIKHVCRVPDLIVYIRGDLQLMQARKGSMQKDAIEQNGSSFYSYVLETYEDLVLKSDLPVLEIGATLTTSDQVDTVLNFMNETWTNDGIRTADPKLLRHKS